MTSREFESEVFFVHEDELHGSIIKRAWDFLKIKSYFKLIRMKGKSPIVGNLRSYNQSAVNIPFWILLDLNGDGECAPSYKKKLIEKLGRGGSNLSLVIAVREAEAWLLADRKNLGAYFRVAMAKIPAKPEEILDPKRHLINLARQSKSRDIAESIAPPPGSTRQIGPRYNEALSKFVAERWDIKAAAREAPSLAYFLQALQKHGGK